MTSPKRTLLAALVAPLSVLLATGCGETRTTLRVFGADSLAASFREIEGAFEKLHPDIDVQVNTLGSVMVARVAPERGADLVALADHRLVEKVLTPKHTSWVVKFVTTEIVLAYTTASKRRADITPDNWFDILLDPQIRYGCARPNQDPCGYYTRISWQLAQNHYFTSRGQTRPLVKQLIDQLPPERIARDANALVGEQLNMARIDYAFVYRTHAVDHKLPFITLPREINLGDATLANLYAAAEGTAPDYKGGSEMLKGAPIAFGISIFDNTPHPKAAKAFVRFVLSDQGLAILERSQFRPIRPALVPPWSQVPEFLSDLAVPENAQAPAARPAAKPTTGS